MMKAFNIRAIENGWIITQNYQKTPNHEFQPAFTPPKERFVVALDRVGDALINMNLDFDRENDIDQMESK